MSQETSSSGLTSYTKDSLFELSVNNPTNTYICIHENVYDVTHFQDEVILTVFLFVLKFNIYTLYFILKQHPGGEEALKEHQIKDKKFKDATESFEDVGHSMDARDMMQKYQIGILVIQFISLDQV